MASQTPIPTSVSAVQVVCNAFVDQYYRILHTNPELVFRFYQESSMLSRPEPNGVMSSVTTMQGINDKILSLNYNSMKAEIKTADAQESHSDGVIILVTGCLTDLDNVKRNFAQTFFLAPQEKGYFVLSDVFRYVDENEPREIASSNGSSADAPGTDVTPTQVTAPPLENHISKYAASIPEDVQDEEVVVETQSEDSFALREKSAALASLSQNEVAPVLETIVAPEDPPKKSYASIVKVMKESKVGYAAAPRSTVRVTPKKNEGQALTAAAQSPESLVSPAPENLVSPASDTPVANTGDAPESSNHHDETESRSIYVSGLPTTLTASELEEVFKKFGPIKTGGVQVRSNKQGFCFGFVQFESPSSVQKALEASPVLIMGKQAFVEEKRGTSSRGTGGGGVRGRFPPVRGGTGGGYRSDSFRGRSNFGARGAYARSDYGSRVNDYGNRGNEYGNRRNDYGNRGRGSFVRDGYQRVDQNGRAEMHPSGGMMQATVSA